MIIGCHGLDTEKQLFGSANKLIYPFKSIRKKVFGVIDLLISEESC
jgi:hypothetical protein